MLTIKDFDFKNKKVLVRCDFDVSLSETGEILEDFRIKKSIPTINYLIKEGAKIILMGHLDRPGGKIVETLRMNSIKDRLIKYLNVSLTKTEDCVGKEVEDAVQKIENGEIVLLENLRFHKEEEENNDNFAKELAKLGDIYINESFATCHRAHASIVGIPKYLPSGAGFLLEKEIKILEDLIKKSEKPVISIIGGKKVETKSKLIDAISEISDYVLIGGLISRELKEKNINLKYPEKIVAPIDLIGTYDLGPKTIKLFKEKISKAKTIFWNGPVGNIEQGEYAKGTKEIAKAIIESGAFSVVGGGETVEFINKEGLTDKFNHVSTGGGAMLDFICDGELVGVEALKNH